AMQELALEHVSDDFHVAVGVRTEPLAGTDAILVHDPQRTETRVCGVVVVGKRKREARLQPAAIGLEAGIVLANGDHGTIVVPKGAGVRGCSDAMSLPRRRVHRSRDSAEVEA